jgi:hypothetical protein
MNAGPPISFSELQFELAVERPAHSIEEFTGVIAAGIVLHATTHKAVARLVPLVLLE